MALLSTYIDGVAVEIMFCSDTANSSGDDSTTCNAPLSRKSLRAKLTLARVLS